MSGDSVLTYTLTAGRRGKTKPGVRASQANELPGAIPRIARLMALAIRLEALVRENVIPDYAEVARRGAVTRARMTQIMKLLDLAPDIQEQILFLPPLPRLNERNLRPIVRVVGWRTQRNLFQQFIGSAAHAPTNPLLHHSRQPVAS